MATELETCIEKVMQTGKHTKEEAKAMCQLSLSNKSKMSKNTVVPTNYTLVSVQRPTIDDPKHTQDYAAFMDESYLNSRCETCKFFIKGNSDVDNQCQLVKTSPLRILPESTCRFWDSVDKLSGFIPQRPKVDESLPTDIIAMMGEKDVDIDETTNTE